MLKLYGGVKSRAAIVEWYLEELQISYEYIVLDLQAGEQTQPHFLEINPIGKVPAIVDGEIKLWESGAILLYLAQKYDPNYPQTLDKQAELYQWILFANSTLSQEIFQTDDQASALQLLTPLNKILANQQWMVGSSFGVIDIAMGSTLAYIPIALGLDLSPFPALVLYIQRLTERPKFQKSIGRRFS